MPPPQDYITKGKTIKKYQNSNEVKMVVLVLGYALAGGTPGTKKITHTHNFVVCSTEHNKVYKALFS